MLMEAVDGSSQAEHPHPHPHSTNPTTSNTQQTISTQRHFQWCKGQG